MTLRHTLFATLALPALVAGCATPLQQQVARDEMLEGQSKTCTVSVPDFSASTTAQASIAMTNEGWCGVTATEKDGKNFKFGLIGTRPQHGQVYVRLINDRTRVEYTPVPRYVGADAFTVLLASKAGGGDSTLKIDVTVTRDPNEPAVAPEKTAPRGPARTPVRPARRTAPR